MKFLVRFAQFHETFRVAELKALATLEGLDLKILHYDPDSPYCVVEMPSSEVAKKVAQRSILIQNVHELWGEGATLDELHRSVKEETSSLWCQYETCSFRFDLESYRGKRTAQKRIDLINSFRFVGFLGPIKMKDEDELFTIFEVWPWNSRPDGVENPDMMYFGRFLCNSSRDLVHTYDLKKRGYISTTSMDSELSLVTANIALAAPGKLFYDPFVGTGSFPLACAHFGAMTWGSDIDGRSMRGEGGRKSLRGNFAQYGLRAGLGDFFAADMTNHPIAAGRRLWDGIVCDPPYGVREGLKVLGLRDPEKTPWLVEKGKQMGSDPDYVPPKKPYSFMAMLDDILDFAAKTLVDNGRLSFWMPTVIDEDYEIPVPAHPCLEEVVVCVQTFRGCKLSRSPHPFCARLITEMPGSRRLITYRRIPDADVSSAAMEAYRSRPCPTTAGTTADELNPFRKAFFSGFKFDKEE